MHSSVRAVRRNTDERLLDARNAVVTPTSVLKALVLLSPAVLRCSTYQACAPTPLYVYDMCWHAPGRSVVVAAKPAPRGAFALGSPERGHPKRFAGSWMLGHPPPRGARVSVVTCRSQTPLVCAHTASIEVVVLLCAVVGLVCPRGQVRRNKDERLLDACNRHEPVMGARLVVPAVLRCSSYQACAPTPLSAYDMRWHVPGR